MCLINSKCQKDCGGWGWGFWGLLNLYMLKYYPINSIYHESNLSILHKFMFLKYLYDFLFFQSTTCTCFCVQFYCYQSLYLTCFGKRLRISCGINLIIFEPTLKKYIWREIKFYVVVYQCFRDYLIRYICPNSSSFIRFTWLSIAFRLKKLIINWTHLFLLWNRT